MATKRNRRAASRPAGRSVTPPAAPSAGSGQAPTVEAGMRPALNLEFARSEKFRFPEALRHAREAGYDLVEPYVYSKLEVPLNSHITLRSASSYHHLNADTANVRAIQALLRKEGLSFSAFDAHSTLLLPQIGIPYLCRALDLAARLECPIVMSDEGPVPGWMPLDRAFDLMCLSLDAVVAYAQSRQVRFALELHNALTTRPEYLTRLLGRFGPAELGVNFDTGNSFLAGNDPVDYLRLVADRVVHVHIKDIPRSQLAQRGKITGTRVGVAAGDGVVDVRGIVSLLAAAGYRGALSVECDTLEQARQSRLYLEALCKNVPNPKPARRVAVPL